MITLVYSYYCNPLMLRSHLQEWESYAPHVKEQFRAIIVDDGSPTEPAINEMREVGFPVELYRIKENVPLNLPGARNLGMHVAPDGWCLLTDIDLMLSADAADSLRIILNTLEPTMFYNPMRLKPDGSPVVDRNGVKKPWHPNTYILQRRLYWLAGGTDEDFSRYWGAGEGAFRKSLYAIADGVRLGEIRLTHFGRDDIPDASTREWGRKGSEYDYNNNPELVKKARGPAYKPVNPLRFTWERVL